MTVAVAVTSIMLSLVLVLPTALAVEGPEKEVAVQVQKQPVKKKVPVTPGAEPLRHRNRAVTQGDYQPIVQSQPGVKVHRVTRPQPTTGGSAKESTTPTERRIPSTLQHRDRPVIKKKSPDDTK